MSVNNRSLLLRLCGIAAIGAATLIGCSDEKKGPEGNPDTTGAAQSAQPSTETSAPTIVTDTAGRVIQMDTSDGTVTVTVGGADKGTFKFIDATASFEERAMAGSTSAIFMLEAHDATHGKHFRIRLRSETGEIIPGTYAIQPDAGPTPLLEGRWETGGKTYNNAKGGSGRLELKTFGERATGTFNMELFPAAADTGASVTVKGSFDQKVWK